MAASVITTSLMARIASTQQAAIVGHALRKKVHTFGVWRNNYASQLARLKKDERIVAASSFFTLA
jgi:hypothetical protein